MEILQRRTKDTGGKAKNAKMVGTVVLENFQVLRRSAWQTIPELAAAHTTVKAYLESFHADPTLIIAVLAAAYVPFGMRSTFDNVAFENTMEILQTNMTTLHKACELNDYDEKIANTEMAKKEGVVRRARQHQRYLMKALSAVLEHEITNREMFFWTACAEVEQAKRELSRSELEKDVVETNREAARAAWTKAKEMYQGALQLLQGEEGQSTAPQAIQGYLASFGLDPELVTAMPIVFVTASSQPPSVHENIIMTTVLGFLWMNMNRCKQEYTERCTEKKHAMAITLGMWALTGRRKQELESAAEILDEVLGKLVTLKTFALAEARTAVVNARRENTEAEDMVSRLEDVKDGVEDVLCKAVSIVNGSLCVLGEGRWQNPLALTNGTLAIQDYLTVVGAEPTLIAAAPSAFAALPWTRTHLPNNC